MSYDDDCGYKYSGCDNDWDGDYCERPRRRRHHRRPQRHCWDYNYS